MADSIKGLEAIGDAADGLQRFAQAFADEFMTRVKNRTPVATGRLQASWKEVVTETDITIFNDAKNSEGVEYGIFVEYGTIHMPGVFMMTRTAAEVEDIVKVAKQKSGLT